ncbi:hypothetical protein BU53_31450 [Escherichia coli O91:H21 str. 2009C-3740]|nr:hypothetical protein BU53_31450 [Escherichia coli O91:H21 str. 2009C-3740]
MVARGLPGFGYLGTLRRNRCGCRTDSFCRLLPARRYRRNGGRRGGHAWTSERNRHRRGETGRRYRVENLRGLHLFPADDGR